MNIITQDMRFKQSLMKYAQKFGVARASRKYNKGKPYIYFWLARYDGTIESLACRSRRPHGHPNAHTEAELKLIRDMRRRNPGLGLVELWHRLRLRGYTRCVESLYRVMCKLGRSESLRDSESAFGPTAPFDSMNRKGAPMFPVKKGKKK